MGKTYVVHDHLGFNGKLLVVSLIQHQAQRDFDLYNQSLYGQPNCINKN